MIINEFITAVNNIKKSHPGFLIGRILLTPFSFDKLLEELKTYSQQEDEDKGIEINCYRLYPDKIFYFTNSGRLKFVKGKLDD